MRLELPQITITTDDIVAIAELIAFDENTNATSATKATNPELDNLWRWERFGHGKYKGRYYRWRKIGDPDRKTIAGGKLENIDESNLGKRPGRGNYTKGAERRKATKATNRGEQGDPAGMGGGSLADDAQRHIG